MKKNILILHTNQQHFDSLGCNGNPSAQTVNIDKLASDGSNLTHHISANARWLKDKHPKVFNQINNAGEEELYDHNIDRQELNNLAYEPTDEYKEICKNMPNPI